MTVCPKHLGPIERRLRASRHNNKLQRDATFTYALPAKMFDSLQ